MEAVLEERQTYIGIGMGLVMVPMSIAGFLLFVLLNNNVLFLTLGPAIGLPIGMSVGLMIWKRRCVNCEGPSRNFERPFLFTFVVGTFVLFLAGLFLLIAFM